MDDIDERVRIKRHEIIRALLQAGYTRSDINEMGPVETIDTIAEAIAKHDTND